MPRWGEYVREAGDNDGGYTGDYLAAQSYRFAITKDPNARREAVNTFQALRWLERMTGLPGFPARAVWAKGERGHKATGGSGGFRRNGTIRRMANLSGRVTPPAMSFAHIFTQ